MTNTKADDVAWASATGEDAFGRWADFTVEGVTQRMRWIDPGSFVMGSPEGEAGRFCDEVQRRVVLAHGYWLADTPVTQALWRAVMGTTEPSRFRGERRPVERVVLHDAMTFCWRMHSVVPGMWLPTEAEWEYAARAGTTTATWNGDLSDTFVAPELDGIAWYAANSSGETHDVATKSANPWGLYDMLGNVWEWCADEWCLPDATEQLVRVGKRAQFVARGGSFFSDALDVRSACRLVGWSGLRNDTSGFRVAVGRSVRR